MRTLHLFIVFLLSVSCTTKKHAKVSPDEYLKLNLLHQPLHKSCLEHRDKVLTKAISEADQAELDDENYFFVRNEKLALEFMSKFDLTKFTHKENQAENEAMIMACVAPVSKSYKACNTLDHAFKYFRGLIYGLRQYQWSQPTKEVAIAQTLKYLQYVGENQSSLMEIFFANDLLMRLANLGYVPTTLYKETIEFRRQGELVHKVLRKKIRKLGKKELTCKDAQDFYVKEREEVVELSQDFLVMLKGAN